MFYHKEYLETSLDNKNDEWADRLITHFREYWQPLVPAKEMNDNMDIILSRYNMENVLKMFKDPKKLGMEFIPLAIMEKVRNIIIGENTKAGLSVSVNALDPVAEEERNKDEKLLANRGEMEAVITSLQKKMGLPEYKLKYEKQLTGKSPFNGNVDMFDELGLDANNPQDRGYFMKAWHRLKHEMDAQEILNSVFRANEVEENIEEWTNEIMAGKAIGCEAYVDQLSGAQVISHLGPAEIHHIPGRKANGSDAICIGYYRDSTVGDVIRRFGDKFDLARDWLVMINAITYTNGSKVKYTGLWNGESCVAGTQSNSMMHVDDFFNFKVQIGKIQWKSQEATVRKMGVDFNGNLRYYKAAYDWSPSADSGYSRETRYNEYLYEAWFVSTASTSQKIFKFGKMFHQVITGADDEYANYGIKYRKVTGPSVAKVAKPWIEIAQECFAKVRWMIRRAKPKGRSYNYESLVQVAKMMVKQGSTKEQVHAVIQMFEEGINEIFTIPKLGGERVGGGVTPNFDLPNGLDPTAITFQAIIDWAVEKIKADLGINDIREAYSPKQNDVYKLQAATLESSRNATSYIGGMLDGLMRDVGKHTLLQSQDIVAYKQSMAYRYLLDMVGNGPIESLQSLDNVAHHRYGIFVTSFNSYLERQNIMRDTQIAFEQGLITYDVKLLINSIDDFRKAAYMLAYEKQRTENIKKQEELDKHTRMMELESARQQTELLKIDRENAGGVARADKAGEWNYKIAELGENTRLNLTDIKGQQRQEEIINKMQADLQKIAAHLNIKNQEPLPA